MKKLNIANIEKKYNSIKKIYNENYEKSLRISFLNNSKLSITEFRSNDFDNILKILKIETDIFYDKIKNINEKTKLNIYYQIYKIYHEILRMHGKLIEIDSNRYFSIMEK